MRIKFLLFFVIVYGITNAQTVCDYPEWVNNKLIITEVRATSTPEIYVEITNLDSKSIRLSEYKLGHLNPWARTGQIFDLCNDAWYCTNHDYMFLPDRVLEPGKSFVLTNAYDYGPRHYKKYKGRRGGNERPKQVGIYEVADKLIHFEEKIDGIYYEGDSITTAHNDPENITPHGDIYYFFVDIVGGTYYLEQFNALGDSAVVDQVGGIFGDNGRNFASVAVDIAGVSGAMNNSVVVRKATVKEGNIDFAGSRGLGLEDSDWMPIPYPSGYNAWRDIFWTIGNHGAYVLDENTLEPANSKVSVDYASRTITVSYGIMRLDDIMANLKKKPGVAWRYDLNPIQSDSLYRSARTGDQLTVYVVGNSLQSAVFNIVVKDPTDDDNFVMPMDYRTIRRPGTYGVLTTRTQNGILSWPRITRHEHGNDTITGSGFGLGFDLRSDSLMTRIEVPSNATWEFVWVDGVPRPDLKNGDKLKVTSKSGKVKEYFLQVQDYWPNENADLSSITWPDIPDFYRGIFGWTGDTIPYFSPAVTNYRVEVPFDIDDIPALFAKTTHNNASVKVTRARSLTASPADRTVIFDVTAENDTVHKSYKVELVKEKSRDKIETFHAEPFISEILVSYPGNHVNFLEIYNPGNQPIDLRNYMVCYLNTDNLFGPILANTSWNNRYTNYIPGLKYGDQETWTIAPRILMPDPGVNPILQGEETFVLANIQRGNEFYSGVEQYIPKNDVQFGNNISGFPNPWNEAVPNCGAPMYCNGLRGPSLFLYKILNDSIKFGLKPNNDPNDFELIDVFGSGDKVNQITIAGITTPNNAVGYQFIRKPEISAGNPEFKGSFGTNPDDCEWFVIRPGTEYSHISTPARYGVAFGNLNIHSMDRVTYFMSTINSYLYKVSDGFGPGENILGVKSGTTVTEFLSNINKENEDQELTVVSGADGSTLDMNAVLNMNDRLEVISADGQNVTVYRLDVTVSGLSNNAYLTSNRWNIQVVSDPKNAGESAVEDGLGTISGFDYGTTVKSVVDNVIVPGGAKLTVINSEGAYTPFVILNYDTAYVNVMVNPDTFLEVVAEDNLTRMVYQLQPNTSESDAFILSDVYEVSQIDYLIHFVPRGTNFNSFLSNIIPSLGASVKLVDKMGFERKQGNIREDDKVVVTSANGEVSSVYFISFLPTSTIPQTLYLAYILSEAYMVNQVDYIISEGLATLTGQTMLDEFLSNIIPSPGATVAVIDKSGNERTTGDLDDGDILKVTSANGKLVTIYTLMLDLESVDQIGLGSDIEIYPNPASDRINIRGIKAGNLIQIYNAAGVLINSVKAQGTLEVISLDRVPSGMFTIVVRDDQNKVGSYKAFRFHEK